MNGTCLPNLFLYSRADTIYGGTNQIQRNLIAERGLGLPARTEAQHGATIPPPTATGPAEGFKRVVTTGTGIGYAVAKRAAEEARGC